MMVVSDGAPGLIKAIDQLWPDTDRQRCTVHKVRNLIAKLPEKEKDRARRQYWQALDEAKDKQDGNKQLRKLVGDLQDQGYHSAAACLSDDLEALTAHLDYPNRLKRNWRSTNLLERSLGEVKRRTKVIGRFPGEHSCLSLCWATLDLVVTNSNKACFTQLEEKQIEKLQQSKQRKLCVLVLRDAPFLSLPVVV